MPAQIQDPNWGFDSEEKKLVDKRAHLREHFLSLKPEEELRGWDDMWQQEITPWDRNQPNPALVETLQKHAPLFSDPLKSENKQFRKKVLVPGCGRGYDVLLFSSYGFDAYGLDASPTAIQEARKLHADQAKDQRYPAQHVQLGRGEAKFIVADFFSNNFLTETHGTSPSDRTFDLIYDYTFLCALPPSFRPKWANRMSQLLSPTGRLICMEYPLGKDPKTGGPPHGLEHELYEQLFANPGREVEYNDSGHVCEDRSGAKSDDALVRVEDFRPDKVFEEQRGSLRVSIWQHWES